MAKIEQPALAPARTRVGLPVLRDGSPRNPFLLRLPDATLGHDEKRDCNNGCADCLTQPIDGPENAFDTDVSSRHVVIRDREPTLRRDLVELIRDLRARNAASISLITNGRLLIYRDVVRKLIAAGAERFIVKLFGLDAATHDAHTQAPGSFEQALAGIRNIRSLRARAFVTFPTLSRGSREEHERHLSARRQFALSVTGHEPVEMPEPQVIAHGGEYRFDLVLLRDGVHEQRWVQSYLPMAHAHVGPACNIRCVYCNVHGGDDQRLFDRTYVEQIISQIFDWRQSHLPRTELTLDFIGGEPTLHPDLPHLIAYAKRIGFQNILICTNGLLLLRPGYLDRLVEAGLTGVRFSLHDHRPEISGQLAAVPGVGHKYVRVAEMLLARRDVRPHIYRILLTQNIAALEDYIRWIAAHNHTGRQIEVMLGMPSQRGRMTAARDLYPPLHDLREHVARSIAVGKSLGLDVVIHHAPACLYPEEPARAMCLHVDAIQVDSLTNQQRGFNTEGDAIHGTSCESCAAKRQGCYGLPRAYFELDAVSAERWLKPISVNLRLP